MVEIGWFVKWSIVGMLSEYQTNFQIFKMKSKTTLKMSDYWRGNLVKILNQKPCVILFRRNIVRPRASIG